MKPLRLTATAALVTLTVLLSACGSGSETPNPTTPGDTTKPSVSLVDLNTAVTQPGEVSLKALAQDNVAVREVKFFVNDQLIATDSSDPYEVKYTWTTSGTYTVRALASDTAGNTNQDVKTVTVTIAAPDDVKPVVSIAVPTETITQAGRYNVTVAASDNVGIKTLTGTVTVQTSAGTQTVPLSLALSGGTVPIDVDSSKNGTYQFEVTATDAAGNTTTVTKTVKVEIAVTQPEPPTPSDTTLPTVSVTAPSGTITSAGTYQFTVSASDNVGVTSLTGLLIKPGNVIESVSLPVAGGAVSLPVNSAADNGTYTLQVTATDVAGNTRTVSRTITVNIPTTPPPGDTTKPTVSVTGPSGTITGAGTYRFTVAASDNVAVTALTGVLTRPNGSPQTVTFPVSGGTVDVPITSADNGSVTLTVTARDAAGNTNSASGSMTVNITTTPPADTTPPTVNVSGPASAVVTAGTYAVFASASDNVGVVSLTGVLTRPNGSTQTLTFSPSGSTQNISVSAADNGTSTLVVTARDAAGLTTTTTISIVVNISNNPPAADTTPPTVSVSAPSGTITKPGFYTVTVAASDNVGVVSLTGVLTTPDGASRTLTFAPTGGSQTIYVSSQYNGTSTLVVTARDAAGLTATATATVTVAIP